MIIGYDTLLRWLGKGVKGVAPLLPADPPPPVIITTDAPAPKTGIIADLWYGPGNLYRDLGRILGTIVIMAAVFVVVFGVVRLGKDPDLLGLAGVVTAVGIWIGLKDFAARKPSVNVEGDLKTANVEGDLNVAGGGSEKA